MSRLVHCLEVDLFFFLVEANASKQTAGKVALAFQSTSQSPLNTWRVSVKHAFTQLQPPFKRVALQSNFYLQLQSEAKSHRSGFVLERRVRYIYRFHHWQTMRALERTAWASWLKAGRTPGHYRPYFFFFLDNFHRISLYFRLLLPFRKRFLLVPPPLGGTVGEKRTAAFNSSVSTSLSLQIRVPRLLP